MKPKKKEIYFKRHYCGYYELNEILKRKNYKFIA